MKQYIKCLAGFIALTIFPALPVSAAATMDMYDGGDHVIFANHGTAAFQAVDGEGNPLEGGSYEILKNGSSYAGWSGNDQSTYSGQYAWRPEETVDFIFRNIPDLVADKGTFCRFSSENADGTIWGSASGSMVFPHEYGTSYTGIYEYIPYEDPVTDLTVPGNTLYFAIDGAWANKKISAGVRLNGMDGTADFTEVNNINFIERAGTEFAMEIPQGKYSFFEHYGNGGGGNDTSPIVISDASTEYVKKRFWLPELMPNTFDENCICHKNMFGTDYAVDPRMDQPSDSYNKYSGMYIVFRSGNVISAALPDADGYVEIYVEKATREIYVSTDFILGTGSGSGVANGKLVAYEQLRVPYSVWSPPENAIFLDEMQPGTYTLHQESAPIGRKLAEDITFTIEECNTKPTFLQMVSEWEDYSVIPVQPRHGTVHADADTYHYQETAQFEAVPDLYYELDHFIAARGSGAILELEADGSSLLMPAENVAVTAVFRCINGDVNMDNEIDASDASLVLIYAAKDGVGTAPVLTDEEFRQMDFNDDGAIDASDASSILIYAAKYGATGK